MSDKDFLHAIYGCPQYIHTIDDNPTIDGDSNKRVTTIEIDMLIHRLYGISFKEFENIILCTDNKEK